MNLFILRNWPTVATVALFILLLVMAIWIPNVNLPGKGLLFRQMDKVPIAAKADSSAPELELLVGGKPVNQPYLSTILIRNSGHIPVKPKDFDSPIQISLQNETKIEQLRYSFIPPEIDTTLTFTPTKVNIAPTLLNPNDTIVVKIFTSGGEPRFNVGARIEGIAKIQSESPNIDPNWGEVGWLQYFFFIVSAFGALLLTVLMQGATNARYLVISKKTAIILYLSIGLVCLNSYFALLVDQALTLYSSRLLLIAMSLLTLLGAVLLLRQTEDQGEM